MSPALAKFFHVAPKEPSKAEQARARMRELTLAITECRAPEPVVQHWMTARDLERELDPLLDPKETPPRANR